MFRLEPFKLSTPDDVPIEVAYTVGVDGSGLYAGGCDGRTERKCSSLMSAVECVCRKSSE